MTLPPPAFLRGLAVLALGVLVGLAGCDGGSNGGPANGVRFETLAGGTNVGDGGLATATFVHPANVAVDARGNVFVIDANDVVAHSILRRIDARTGAITTVGGPCDPYVQADPPSAICDLLAYGALALGDGGDIFLGTFDQQIFRVDVASGALALLAGLGGFGCDDAAGARPAATGIGVPVSVARNAAGDLYFGELDSRTDVGALRRLDPSFTQLTTVAPGERANDLAIDAHGTLFVADVNHHRLDRVDAASGAVTTIAGGSAGRCDGERGDGGPAALACFVAPTGVAVREDGTIFVADGDRIRRIDAESATIDTVAERTYVEHLAVAPGRTLVFTEPTAYRVTRLDVGSGAVTAVAGNGTRTACGEGGVGNAACIGAPYGAAPAPDGSVYFADGDNQRIGRIDATGRVTTVVDHDSAGSCGDTGPRRDFCLADPSAVVRDRGGILYFADRGTAEEGDDDTRPGRVRRFDPATGVVTTIAGNCTVPGSTEAREECVIQPSSLLLDGHGGLYVGSQVGVHRIDLGDGTIRHVVGGRRLAANCKADGIEAVDACIAGNDLARDAAGNLYVSSIDDYRVWRVDAGTGLITTFAGSGGLVCQEDDVPAPSACVYPFAIAVDDGRLVIATDGTLRSVDLASGLIHTVAGLESGCGSVAPIPADCIYPSDMTIDADGRLVVAESASRSIRRVTLP